LYIQSETYAAQDQIEDALKCLKKICFILPPMALQKLNYLDKSEKIQAKLLE
jgi:hypothetical protein